jgi:hypothetical protein
MDIRFLLTNNYTETKIQTVQHLKKYFHFHNLGPLSFILLFMTLLLIFYKDKAWTGLSVA